MTLSGLTTFWSAVAAVSVSLLLIRVTGEFVVGHSIRANRWFRDRDRNP